MSDTTTLSWQRSSFCAAGSCVEVAVDGDKIAVRDGKNTDIPALKFSKADWHSFLDQVAAGGRSHS